MNRRYWGVKKTVLNTNHNGGLRKCVCAKTSEPHRIPINADLPTELWGCGLCPPRIVRNRRAARVTIDCATKKPYTVHKNSSNFRKFKRFRRNVFLFFFHSVIYKENHACVDVNRPGHFIRISCVTSPLEPARPSLLKEWEIVGQGMGDRWSRNGRSLLKEWEIAAQGMGDCCSRNGRWCSRIGRSLFKDREIVVQGSGGRISRTSGAVFKQWEIVVHRGFRCSNI